MFWKKKEPETKVIDKKRFKVTKSNGAFDLWEDAWHFDPNTNPAYYTILEGLPSLAVCEMKMKKRIADWVDSKEFGERYY